VERLGVLAGVRVLELAHMVAAPVCGVILADLGAEVTKIELPPRGDLVRDFGPRLSDGITAMFAAVNRSKQSLFLDIGQQDGRERIAALAGKSDVLVTNIDDTRLAAAGLDAKAVSIRFPGLIYVRVSAFGPVGPPGTDSLAQAATGMTVATGPAEASDGVRVGPPVVDVATGVWAALAVLTALERRRQTGTGQVVDVSLEDVSLHLQLSYLAMEACEPGSARRRGNHSPLVCTPVFRTATGRLFVSLVTQRHWGAFAVLLGQGELREDPRFATATARQLHQEDLERALETRFGERPAAEWVEILNGAGIPATVERDYRAVLADQRHHGRGTFFTTETGLGAGALQVASPIRFSSGKDPKCND
jgi:crotonobetainyl-CoA:carnitine CoA-transferase CaiB-like acyl-CoA transferase